MSDIKIVLASGNRHKYEEYTDFFASLAYASGERVYLLNSGDFDLAPSDIEESGSSYEENAAIKARAYARFLGLPAIADDSGLEVRVLGWRPGIYSSRAASGGDGDRISWLLGQMDGKNDRRARFRVSLVMAFPGSRGGARDYFSSEGVCWGNISRDPSGEDGFGYDPVFVPDGHQKSFAELGRAIKREISHRAIAMRGVAILLPHVVKYFLAYCG
ncbi:MAG: non-canonical purine NTP pyrophosphatase, RdgB/HAM1 family [Synergistaceae bacterium]|nr:non-canonical purine NTP pyrophosphatase, RdgB/HAM1 family [Synergistaceae bacterium]